MKPVFFVGFISLLLASPVIADDAMRGACAGDVEKFCKGIPPGGGKILRCLSEHKNELSENCRKEGETKRAAFMKMRVACKAEAKKLCTDKRRPRDVVFCLKEKSKELTGECKTVVDSLPAPSSAKQ